MIKYEYDDEKTMEMIMSRLKGDETEDEIRKVIDEVLDECDEEIYERRQEELAQGLI